MSTLALNLLLSVALSNSCNSAPVPKFPKRQYYYPVEPETKWVYDSGGHELALVVHRVERVGNEYFVHVAYDDPTGGLTRSAYLTERVSEKQIWRRAKGAGRDQPGDVLLKAPFVKNTTWEYTIKGGQSGGGLHHVRTIAGEETVKVPAGEFPALRVDWEVSVNGKTRRSGSDWYAIGVGLVKQVQGDSVTVLKSFKKPER